MVMGMEDIERATTLKKSGLSYRQISDLMHIHPATLHRNLRGRV
jgi:IS30 family transposase